MFASNWGCVTSQGAKTASAGTDCSGDIDRAGRSSPGWREPVCAITRRTSKDSAGTDPQSRRAAQNSQHERYPVGRTRTQRHHDSTNLLRRPQGFPAGKNIPAARSFPLIVFAAVGDQGSFPHQPQSCLAARCTRKMALAECASSAVTRCLHNAGFDNIAGGSRNRICSNECILCCYCDSHCWGFAAGDR